MFHDIPMLAVHPPRCSPWQDYPSGWARALAGDANAAHARELMALAEAESACPSLLKYPT